MERRGKLSWEVIGIIVLCLAVLVIMVIFSKGVRDKIILAWKEFMGMLLGRRL